MLDVKRGPAYYKYYNLCENLVHGLEYLISRYKLSHFDLTLRFTFDDLSDSFYRFEEKLISIDLYRVYTHCDFTANDSYQVLSHEFCHFLQHCEGRLSPSGFHIVYEGKLYDAYFGIYSREYYVQLPWEKEANDFMRTLTPDVLNYIGVNR